MDDAMESLVEQLYRDAGIDPSRPDVLRLCVSLGLRVRCVDRLGKLADLNGSTVRLLRRAGARAKFFACAHEVGHHVLGHKPGHENAKEEREATALGCILLVPSAALYAHRLAAGYRIDRIADSLTTTQTIVARRWRSVFDDEPVALVLPDIVLAGAGWPPARKLRLIAATGKCPNARVIPFTDRKASWMIAGCW